MTTTEGGINRFDPKYASFGPKAVRCPSVQNNCATLRHGTRFGARTTPTDKFNSLGRRPQQSISILSQPLPDIPQEAPPKASNAVTTSDQNQPLNAKNFAAYRSLQRPAKVPIAPTAPPVDPHLHYRTMQRTGQNQNSELYAVTEL